MNTGEAPDQAGILTLIREGNLAMARQFAQAQIDRYGRMPELLQPMGEILLRLGRNAESLTWFEAACAIQADDLNTWNQRALALSRLLRYTEAHQAYLQALRCAPHMPALFANIGANFNRAQCFREAEHWLRQGLELDAEAWDVQTNLANALIGQNRMAEARVMVTTLLQKGYRDAKLLQAHAMLLHAEGQPAKAETLLRQLLAHDPSQDSLQSYWVFTLNYSEQADASELLTQARHYGAMLQAHQVRLNEQPHSRWCVEHRPTRLRVGLVSGDFRNHPVGYFLEAVVPALRSRSIELLAYPTLHQEDELTQRMQPHFAGWRPLVGLDNTTAAQRIHADGVHVLVDLSGHTTGHRLPVFALKPAPVQATWLGYLGTSGLPDIDWVIADEQIAPVGTEEEFVEGIWRMPQSYVHLSPPTHPIEPTPLPALEHGYLTFGCFNNLAKMTDAVVALWARVLHAVPDSRLFLKCPQLQEEAVAQRTLERYARHGIGAERLMLEGPSPRITLLKAYNRVDIALDPFPYTGGTTSLEALWMSVPVLTLRGKRFMSRMGGALLTHAGLSDWIAEDTDHLVQLALSHTRDLNRLAHLRAGLRAQVLASPLMDTPRFAQAIEEAWWGMWQHWQMTTRQAAHAQRNPA